MQDGARLSADIQVRQTRIEDVAADLVQLHQARQGPLAATLNGKDVGRLRREAVSAGFTYESLMDRVVAGHHEADTISIFQDLGCEPPAVDNFPYTWEHVDWSGMGIEVLPPS